MQSNEIVSILPVPSSLHRVAETPLRGGVSRPASRLNVRRRPLTRLGHFASLKIII